MTGHHSTHSENPWYALMSFLVELAEKLSAFISLHPLWKRLYILDLFLSKLQWFTLFIPWVKLLQFVPLKFIKKIFFSEAVAQTLFFTQKCFAIGITYSNIILKKLFHIFFFSGIFAPPWFMAAFKDGAEIKLLYTVQTINSILNLAASEGKWWGKKKEKTETKSNLVLHMSIIYLGGFSDATCEKRHMWWRNNRGGMYN